VSPNPTNIHIGRTLRLLYHPASQPCRAVHQFLHEIDIPFEEEIIDISTDINERQEFRDTYNPTGQVPILVDGEFTVWENIAIARYVNEKFDVPGNWFGRDSQQRAHIDQFVQWYAYTLRLGGGAFHWNIFGPLIYGEKIYSDKFAVEQKKGRTLLYEAMGILENYWLKDRKYVCGDAISYADLVAFHEFVSHDAGRIIPESVWSGFPKITAWFERLSGRPHARTVSEWQYAAVGKILRGELTGSMFSRRTAVLKGTEVFSGHNHGIPYLNESVDTYIERVEREGARAA
jgi:glutathione S-transferase